MPTRPIYVIGAGGHAKVVVDALLEAGVVGARIAVSDSNPARAGTSILGIAVRTPAVRADMVDGYFHVAIGDPGVRKRLHQELLALGAEALTVLHPRSVKSASATLGRGVFLAAHCVVGPEAQLGDGVIVNHGAVVDHDCRVGCFSHLAPNVTLGGAVDVGERVLVGAGANVLPGLIIGSTACIGAGAVVLNDVESGSTVVGVPAVLKVKGIM